MGDVIQLLPDHVANQIAAGEVVQRPASVVKELLENAIDAGAKYVELHIHKAGKERILVQDNGQGMSPTDLRMAFERHATSKIRNTQDIFAIRTKGFRGEALASIAAVAQVEAKTQRDSDSIGSQITLEGNLVSEQTPIPHKKGTSISVKNLFFNVPARRNFLKSDNVELRHIQDEFIRLALVHEDVHFVLSHNGSELYHLVETNFQNRILHIFGKRFGGNLVAVQEKTELVNISGFVGKPVLAKKSRGEQFFFVNNRFVRSAYLHKAVLNAFDGLLPNGQHPSYFLRLDLPPEKIDINIHPSKTEVKFEDETAIFAVIRTAIKHALGQYNVVPSLDFDQNPEWAFLPKPNKKNISTPHISVNPDFNPFVASKPERNALSSPTKVRSSQRLFSEGWQEQKDIHLPFEESTRSVSHFLWNNHYLVFAHENDLLLIDPFRAHQRILFEQLIAQNDAPTVSQQLLFPFELEIDAQLRGGLEQIETDLLEMGFDFRVEENKLFILSIPEKWNYEDLPEILERLNDGLRADTEALSKRRLAAILATGAAKNKGKSMSKDEQAYLAKELLQLDQAHISPMGKTVFIRIPLSEMQKKFD